MKHIDKLMGYIVVGGRRRRIVDRVSSQCQRYVYTAMLLTKYRVPEFKCLQENFLQKKKYKNNTVRFGSIDLIKI